MLMIYTVLRSAVVARASLHVLPPFVNEQFSGLLHNYRREFSLILVAAASMFYGLVSVALRLHLHLHMGFGPTGHSQRWYQWGNRQVNLLTSIISANNVARKITHYLHRWVPQIVEHSQSYIDLLVNCSDSSHSRRCNDTL